MRNTLFRRPRPTALSPPLGEGGLLSPLRAPSGVTFAHLRKLNTLIYKYTYLFGKMIDSCGVKGWSRCRHVLAPKCAAGGPKGPPVLRFSVKVRPQWVQARRVLAQEVLQMDAAGGFFVPVFHNYGAVEVHAAFQGLSVADDRLGTAHLPLWPIPRKRLVLQNPTFCKTTTNLRHLGNHLTNHWHTVLTNNPRPEQSRGLLAKH